MNVLICTGPGIGDMLQKLPMASAIKAQYPDANIDFIMSSPPQNWNINIQVLQCQNYVRNLYWYSVKYKLHCAKLLLQLRMNHYDLGFERDSRINVKGTGPSFWILHIMRWSGVKKIAGYVKDYVDIFVDVPEISHFIERDRITLNAAGITAPMTTKTIDTSKLDFSFPGCERLKESRKVIAFSVGTNAYPWVLDGKTVMYDVKSWPYEKWVELATMLAGENIDVVLVGGKKEMNELAQKNIAFPENEHIFNLIGRTNLKQSLAVLSLCSLAVGAEGGMMHCASGLGVKTLTIFGGSDYRIWTPAGGDIVNLNLDCAPCYATKRGAECKYHRCLEEIDADMVFRRIMEL